MRVTLTDAERRGLMQVGAWLAGWGEEPRPDEKLAVIQLGGKVRKQVETGG